MADMVEAWFPTNAVSDGARLTLFCFPHGGGSAASFQDWQSSLKDEIDVCPAALPGRERRIAEPLIPSISGLADALVQPILRRARTGPFALFGHSMGALTAFELAHRLTAEGRPPSLLAVSGAAAPHLPLHVPQSQGLSDHAFLDAVNELGGTPAGLLDVAEMRQLLLPILRADYAAFSGYEFTPRPVLDTPLLVLGGGDDKHVAPAQLDQWRGLTSGPTTVKVFRGGHFFILDHLSDVLTVIKESLAECIRASGARQMS